MTKNNSVYVIDKCDWLIRNDSFEIIPPFDRFYSPLIGNVLILDDIDQCEYIYNKCSSHRGVLKVIKVSFLLIL